jgi:predicted permease
LKTLRRLLVRLVASITRRRDDARLKAEVEEHLALQTAENIGVGMSPTEAHRQAVLKFGAVEALKEDYRDQRGLPFLDHLLLDLRYAVRSLYKSPGFAAVAVLTLALGTAGTVSIFAFVDAALLRPLPYEEPTRLVTAFGMRSQGAPNQTRGMVSYLNFLDWRERNQVFGSIAAYDVRSGFNLIDSSGVHRVSGLRVTSGFFRTLGVAPILGREFRRDEEGSAAPATIMLAYSAWQTRFGGKPDIIGETVTLQSGPHVIIGVLPRGFQFAMADHADFWVAIRGRQPCWELRGCRSLETIARLADGVSLESATTSLGGLIRDLEDANSAGNPDSAKIVTLNDVIFRDVRPMMLMLLSGAALLLLIASINVVSLILARADARNREIAIQNALGASSCRLLSRFATEALVLVALSGVLGLTLAVLGTRFLKGLLSADMIARMPYLVEVGLNGRLIAFAGMVSVFAAIVLSVTPIVRLETRRSLTALKEGSRNSAGTTWRRFGSSLVIAELGMAVLLLAGGALLGKSAYRLLHAETGFASDHLVTLAVGPTSASAGSTSEESPGTLAQQVAQRVAAVPGVQSVAYADLLPLARGLAPSSGFQVEGGAVEPVEDHPVRRISAGYFTTLQARLLRGRFFTEEEVASNRRLVIINDTAARRYFSGDDPIGRRFVVGAPPAREVVGVITDIKDGPPETPPHPSAYVPFDQVPFNLVVRTAPAQQSIVPALTGAIREVRRDLLVQGGRSMTEQLNGLPSVAQQRAIAWVVGGFALMALVLSVVGLYGVVAYSVGQRTREIGVRMALGAQRRSLYQLIVGEAAMLVAIGTGVGVISAVIATSFMRRFLFGVQSWDGWTLTSSAAVLVISALLASYIPARRASRVDPIVALRYE